ncbi:MAG: hypothetical protein KJT03_07715 [Verrucomicrobiae bacterium]|nr:hypothetical protein [Verrucomicrobiae bacterium]
MKPTFELEVVSVDIVHELPNTWTNEDCRALLDALEFGDASDISDDQLREYAVMALQDLEDDKAAGILLNHVFGDKLSAGKKQNLADEMTDERPWEEYPDLSCHEPIFNAQYLLHQAYPQAQQPEIHKVVVILSSLNQPAELYLQAHDPETAGNSIPEALIVRCLAVALPEQSILFRLFEDQLTGTVKFSEAEHILWHVYPKKLPSEGDRLQRYELTLYCPVRWTGGLKKGTVIDCEPFIRDIDNIR